MRQITSTSNPEIKQLIQILEKSKVRRQENSFVVEGHRLLRRAIECGYEVQRIYCLPDNVSTWQSYSENIIIISPNIISKVCVMNSDVIAILTQKDHSLDTSIMPAKDKISIVLSGLEKPGNIGAILRSADASGVDTIYLSSENADLYNPHCLRNSTGAIFNRTIYLASTEYLIQYLQQNTVPIYTTHLDARSSYLDINYKEGGVIVFGTESEGVEDIWVQVATQCIKIPMMGISDSLNVSISAAVILYEALRQRKL